MTTTATQRTTGPLCALYVADAVSRTGNMMTLTAIPWFVLQTTGSATKTGITAFFNLVPIVLASLLGGTLIDRLGFKRMSVSSDLISAVMVALIPLFHLTTGLPFWLLITFVFLGALFDTPGMTARSALMPDAAALAGWTLERATGVSAALERASRLVGAPLAGVLIAFIGPVNVLWLDAFTFLVSAVLVGWAFMSTAAITRSESSGYLVELKEGFAFLRTDRTLLAIVLTVTATNFLDSWSMVLLPLYADRVYGSAITLGLMIGAMGAGSVVGALVFAGRGHLHSRRRVFAVCFMGVAIHYPVLAMFPSAGVAIAAKFVTGLAAGPLNPIIDTIKYERVPPRMRGRVFGVIHSAAWMAMPLGVLVAGFVLDRVSLRVALLVLGALYVLVTGSIWANRPMKDMEKAPDPRVAPAVS